MTRRRERLGALAGILLGWAVVALCVYSAILLVGHAIDRW